MTKQVTNRFGHLVLKEYFLSQRTVNEVKYPSMYVILSKKNSLRGELLLFHLLSHAASVNTTVFAFMALLGNVVVSARIRVRVI